MVVYCVLERVADNSTTTSPSVTLSPSLIRQISHIGLPSNDTSAGPTDTSDAYLIVYCYQRVADIH